MHLYIYVWALSVTACFFGWGALVVLCLGLSRTPAPIWGAVGVLTLTTVAGVLNLLHVLTPGVLSTIVWSGAALAFLALALHISRARAAIRVFLQTFRDHPFTFVITSAAMIMILLIGAASANRKLFLESDDFAAYLTYPIKTFALGTVPAEPFSERRIASSVGTNYALEALMLPSGNIRSVPFVDVGFGYILLFVTAWSLFRAYGISSSISPLLSAFIVLLPFVRGNLQMQILPCAMFLAIALMERTVTGWRFALLFGLAIAAVSGMKQSYVPVAVLLPCCYYLLRFMRGSRNAPAMFGITAATGLTAMLPWMLDSYSKQATLFYPLLGSGYHASAYGFAPTFSRAGVPLLTMLSIAPLAIPLMLLLVPVYRTYRERVEGMEMCLSLLASAAVAVVAIGFATSGESVGRYTLPFVNAAALVLLAVFFQTRFRGWPRALFATWGCFLVLYYGFYRSGVVNEFREIQASLIPASFQPGFDEAFLDDDRVKSYEAMAAQYQHVIPAGQRILSAVSYSFPLDFKRNPIWIADFPGMSSLPPGMPTSDPGRLRRYLLANGIRYVVFRQQRHPERELNDVQEVPARRAYLRTELTVSLKTLMAFAALKEHSRVLLDLNDICAIDLAG